MERNRTYCGALGPVAHAASRGAVSFTEQPEPATAGQALRPVVVEILDMYGNLTNANLQVSLALTPSDVLQGTRSANAIRGRAIFLDLSIDKTGHAYTLQ